MAKTKAPKAPVIPKTEKFSMAGYDPATGESVTNIVTVSPDHGVINIVPQDYGNIISSSSVSNGTISGLDEIKNQIPKLIGLVEAKDKRIASLEEDVAMWVKKYDGIRDDFNTTTTHLVTTYQEQIKELEKANKALKSEVKKLKEAGIKKVMYQDTAKQWQGILGGVLKNAIEADDFPAIEYDPADKGVDY